MSTNVSLTQKISQVTRNLKTEESKGQEDKKDKISQITRKLKTTPKKAKVEKANKSKTTRKLHKDNVEKQSVEIQEEHSHMNSDEHDLLMQETNLHDHKMGLKNEMSQFRRQQRKLQKAEKHLQMNENRLNKLKMTEIQREQKYNMPLSQKEQKLDQQNMEVQKHKMEAEKSITDIKVKIGKMKEQLGTFEAKMSEANHQASLVKKEEAELDRQSRELNNATKIASTEALTAKKEQADIDKQRGDLNNRAVEIKNMEKESLDLKAAYSNAYHKLIVHENFLSKRDDMILVAEKQVDVQNKDIDQKLGDFEKENDILKSREAAVDLKEGQLGYNFKTQKRSLTVANKPDQGKDIT